MLEARHADKSLRPPDLSAGQKRQVYHLIFPADCPLLSLLSRNIPTGIDFAPEETNAGRSGLKARLPAECVATPEGI